MSYETLEMINAIASSKPDSFKQTINCLDRRAAILSSIDSSGDQHDSLFSQSKCNYAVLLENCDIMLERVFVIEYDKAV